MHVIQKSHFGKFTHGSWCQNASVQEHSYSGFQVVMVNMLQGAGVSATEIAMGVKCCFRQAVVLHSPDISEDVTSVVLQRSGFEQAQVLVPHCQQN